MKKSSRYEEHRKYYLNTSKKRLAEKRIAKKNFKSLIEMMNKSFIGESECVILAINVKRKY